MGRSAVLCPAVLFCADCRADPCRADTCRAVPRCAVSFRVVSAHCPCLGCVKTTRNSGSRYHFPSGVLDGRRCFIMTCNDRVITLGMGRTHEGRVGAFIDRWTGDRGELTSYGAAT